MAFTTFVGGAVLLFSGATPGLPGRLRWLRLLVPLVVGIFFLGAVQLIFLGIVGEYVGAIYTQVLHRPLVIEKERINFDDQSE